MAGQKTGPIHHVGTFLCLAAGALLLVTTITAPVVNNLAILRVDGRNSAITFGTFGYCVIGGQGEFCSQRTIGYAPATIIAQISGAPAPDLAGSTANALTSIMVLHPVACALAFIAFLSALGSGFCGSLIASIIAGLAWLVTLIVMATDFALFGIVKNDVNDAGRGSSAYYSVGMWTILAAMICLFLATIILFFTCCTARRQKRRGRVGKETYVDGPVATRTTRRRFWQRRSRY